MVARPYAHIRSTTTITIGSGRGQGDDLQLAPGASSRGVGSGQSTRGRPSGAGNDAEQLHRRAAPTNLDFFIGRKG